MTLISKLTSAKDNFSLFFQTFEWTFVQNVRKPSIFEWHLSPNWPVRRAKENFWLFFQTFEWIFPQNVRKPSIFEWHLSSNWPARSAKENCWLFFQYFEWICFKMWENPQLKYGIYLQVDPRKVRKKIFDCFSIFWVDLLHAVKTPHI